MAWRRSGDKPLSEVVNQCWNIVNLTLGNKLQWNFNRNSNIFIEENTFENVFAKCCSFRIILNVLTLLLMHWLLTFTKHADVLVQQLAFVDPDLCRLMASFTLAWSLTKLQWISTCEVVQLWSHISCKPLGLLGQLHSWLSWVSSYWWVSAR